MGRIIRVYYNRRTFRVPFSVPGGDGGDGEIQG